MRKSAWRLLKLLLLKHCQTQLKNLLEASLNVIESFSLLALLLLVLSGHLWYPNTSLRCMKVTFLYINIKHNNSHKKCRIISKTAFLNLNMEDSLNAFLSQKLKSSEITPDGPNCLFWNWHPNLIISIRMLYRASLCTSI